MENRVVQEINEYLEEDDEERVVEMESEEEFELELEDKRLYKELDDEEVDEHDDDVPAQVVTHVSKGLSARSLAHELLPSPTVELLQQGGALTQQQLLHRHPHLATSTPVNKPTIQQKLFGQMNQDCSPLPGRILTSTKTGDVNNHAADVVDKSVNLNLSKEKDEKNRTLRNKLKEHNDKVKKSKVKKLIREKKIFKPMPIQFPSPDRVGATNFLDTPQLPPGQDKVRSSSSSNDSSRSNSSFGLDMTFTSTRTLKTPGRTPAIPRSKYRNNMDIMDMQATQYSFTYSQLDKTGKTRNVNPG